MCIQNVLLSDGQLPEVLNDPEYPDLRIERVDPFSELTHAVLRLLSPSFLYMVQPNELCGCYFCYDNLEVPEHPPGLSTHMEDSGELARDAQSIWCQGFNAVNSMSRYLSRHVGSHRLGLYVCWEGEEGSAIQIRQVVRTDFFRGEKFARLSANSLYIISEENSDRVADWFQASQHDIQRSPDVRGFGRETTRKCQTRDFLAD